MCCRVNGNDTLSEFKGNIMFTPEIWLFNKDIVEWRVPREIILRKRGALIGKIRLITYDANCAFKLTLPESYRSLRTSVTGSNDKYIKHFLIIHSHRLL